jgi:hypothetical protein
MIPKKIHYCWLSGDPFPDLIVRCMASWRKALPDYELVLWDSKRFEVDRLAWVREAFAAGKYAFASDYIRLHALYEEGGIYLDADVEVLGNFNALLNERSFIGYERSGDLEAAVIGAEKGCAWIAACLEHYNGRHFVQPNGSRDTTPLPVIVETTLNHLGLMPPAAPTTTTIAGPAITFCPADYFSPKDMHGEPVRTTPHTIAIHHFDGQWVERTAVHALKQRAHRVLHRLLGAKNHRRVVKALRALRG